MKIRKLIPLLIVAPLLAFLLLKVGLFRQEQEVDFSRFRVGDWTVYCDKGNRGVLTVLNAQTKEKKVITNGNSRILDVSEGKVYYYDYFHASTCRIVLSERIGGAELVMSEDPESLVAVDNSVYYVGGTDGFLYVLESGQPEAKLVSSAYCSRVKTDGLWVYFINISLDRALQRVHTKMTQEAEVIHPGIVNEYELSQDKVFLTLPDQAGHLFRLSTDGSELMELSGETAYDLHILDDEVYFRVGPAGRLFKMDPDGSDVLEVTPGNR